MKKISNYFKNHLVISLVIFSGLAIFLLLLIYFFLWQSSEPVTKWGVTFSPAYVEEGLGLDNWESVYLAILNDLQVDNLRLSAYWNRYESQKDVYDFTDLDWQIDQASKRNIGIILAVGRRLPRWPECHDPDWLADLPAENVEKELLEYIEITINRYKDNKNIKYWQVENEPYLKYFGLCPPLDEKLFKKEIALVRSLDSRPILITDSGELSFWVNSSRAGGDILGSTLYRVVYNPIIGYVNWFVPPAFYQIKSQFSQIISDSQKTIIAELQAEPWHPENKKLNEMSIQETNRSLSLERFKKNINFTNKIGFDEAYLWGVEWWYYAKEKRNYPDFWEEAKKLWQ